MSVDVFGPMFVATDLELAVVDTLQTWGRTYLRGLERKRGLAAGALPLPRSWWVKNELARGAQEQLPAVIVVSPGVAAAPSMTGDGDYSAEWTVGVAIVVAVPGGAAQDVAKLYAAAFRTLLMENPPLGLIEWGDENYDDVPQAVASEAAVANLVFTITVDGVLNIYDGPSEPIDEPGDWPTATEVIVDRDDGTRLADVLPEEP